MMKRNNIASVAGDHLKGLRYRLGITTRQVEKLSEQIAKSKNTEEFCISHAWLTSIENGEFTPSIYKLYTLSAIYRYKFADLLSFFGLRLDEMTKDILSIRLPATHLVGKASDLEEDGLSLPTRFDPYFQPEKTSLISRLIENWAKIPISMVSHLNFGQVLCGYIGLEDFTLYPLLRPGSFVEIDSRQNKIKLIQWRTEFERPIYFVELRTGYICGWCEVDGNQLTIIPHPQSKQEVRRFQYPTQAEVVGRVVSVAMRLVQLEPEPS